jgi:hypothetical protein
MLSVIKAVPSSVYVENARWRIFCHVLRMKENVSARHEMTCYFNEKSHKLRQGIFLSIAPVPSDEYKAAFKKSI